MDLMYHTGYCCGVKQIWGFGPAPKALLDAIPKPAKPQELSEASTLRRVYTHENIPAETAEARLGRYVKYVIQKWPGHLIEACLIVEPSTFKGYENQKAWIPIVEEMGFHKVNEFKNSNTSNTIGVYHLVVKGGEVYQEKKGK